MTNQNISLNKIFSAVKETFYYNVRMIKQNDTCEIYLRHKNLLFDFEVRDTQMNLITRYLSPCMYIRNKIDPYEKNNSGDYVITETGKFIDEKKTCIEFDNSKIPVDYVIISKLFSFLYPTNPSYCKNVKQFDIIVKKEIDMSYYETKKNELSNIKYTDCWSDFMNYNGTFNVHDKKWCTADLGWAQPKGGPISPFTQKVFDKINTSIQNSEFKCIDENLNVVKFEDEFRNYKNKIQGVAKMQGGIDLTAFFNNFGYYHLLSPYNNNYQTMLIRCSNNLMGATSEDNLWNNYYCDKSDFQSVVILNEFIKTEGIQTTLTYKLETETSKNDDILFISDNSIFYPMAKYFKDNIFFCL